MTETKTQLDDRVKWWVQEMVQYLQSDDSLKYGLRRGIWRLVQGREYVQGLSGTATPEELASLSELLGVAEELSGALEPVMQQLQDALSDIRRRLVGPPRM